MKTSQFWLIYLMPILSVFQGYYTLNIYKAYGYTKDVLADDFFITKVGSISAFMGAMRFFWSALMDCHSFKRVYGVMLVAQTVLGATIDLAARTRPTFAIWLALMVFLEGAHFVVVPNALRQLYKEAAPSIYGVVFSFTGFSNLIIIGVVQSEFGKNHALVYMLSAGLSAVALCLLIFCFKEVH